MRGHLKVCISEESFIRGIPSRGVFQMVDGWCDYDDVECDEENNWCDEDGQDNCEAGGGTWFEMCFELYFELTSSGSLSIINDFEGQGLRSFK